MWINPAGAGIVLALLLILGIAYLVSFGMQGLYPFQRVVVLLGVLAAAVQVICPPCLFIGDHGLPVPVGRHLMPAS
jgi:membrane-bound metal-dependent hydrolase YbcI (DUF457 family)